MTAPMCPPDYYCVNSQMPIALMIGLFVGAFVLMIAVIAFAFWDSRR